MSKLTEIKEALSKITQGIWWHYQTNNSVVVDPKDPIFIRKTVADCGNFDNAKFIANAPEYITYLLSLLEEKETKYYVDMNNMRSSQQTEMLMFESRIVELSKQVEEKDKAQREQVRWFSNQMEQRLKENDHKTGWEDCDRMFLLNRLEANFHSLWAKQQAYGACFDAEGTIRKAANISNFAMMIADNARKALNTSSNNEGEKSND